MFPKKYIHKINNEKRILEYGINFHFVGAENGEELGLYKDTACGLVLVALLKDCEVFYEPYIIKSESILLNN